MLWRAFHSRRRLDEVAVRTAEIRLGQILAFACMRNEIGRLPYFLAHYRALGVAHFLVVDNGSDDGTTAFLAGEPDVSLWTTDASYRASRFGMDWLTWLLMRYGHDHWCLTVDADELLLIPHWPRRGLRDLTGFLEAEGRVAFGALMLDLYPSGALSTAEYSAGTNPLRALTHFDSGPYRAVRKWPEGNLLVQGGPRDRQFFADRPERAPTMNKLPLVRWHRRYVYRNSTHSILPRGLNHAYDGPGDSGPCGVLLHTKFLPSVVRRSVEEKARREHFGTPDQYGAYYDALAADPILWNPDSVEFNDWRQLAELGLMSAGNWT